ncbi:MAG: hypothetical protein M1820_002303 [Bogoriella megaspora]|nr:MAG: hypothetical protein M1820_002303 [Bogoriella megaspora]
MPLIDERTGTPYAGNWIRSNKYTPWTFVPRQLLAQFSKLANFYLLCFAIMQLIPGLSTVGNYTNIVPLMVFISISMAKEGYDDYKRYRLDKEENRQETLIIDTAAAPSARILNWRTEQWRYLRVGDIIKLKRDELIPADVVLLGLASLGESKVGYIETIALDGETSLKRKHPVKIVTEACDTFEKFMTCSIDFIAEDPNPDLSTFKGKVIVKDQTSSLTNDNIIYRGSVLRNTSEVTAMIIYSGEECKIRMNARGNGNARIKAPRLQPMLNKIVVLMVCLVIGLSVYNTLAYQAWKSDVERRLFYLSSAAVPLHEEAFGFIIMFATMVPLSLYVSMEMIKLAQMFFLNADVEMYDSKSNIPFEARTSTINEDLGQITHIFSDKTGTLTDNEMRFRKLYVAGTEWAHESIKTSSRDAIEATSWSPFTPSTGPSRGYTAAERTTRELVTYLSEKPDSAFAHKAKLMLLCMALCHSCVPEVTQNGTVLDFQASSPDELALVRAAREMGFLMCSRDHESITLALSSPTRASNGREIYDILNIIDFSNDRRRMTVIVRFPDRRICIICKGADTVIMERLKLSRPAARESGQSQQRKENANQGWSHGRIGIDDNPAVQGIFAAPNTKDINIFDPPDARRTFVPLDPRQSTVDYGKEFPISGKSSGADSLSDIERCTQSVNKFANESFRTLVYAYRFIDEREYEDWKKAWDVANASTSNHEKIVECAEELIEADLELAGATAIEDKLQEGIPESIDKLCRANIKVWMLTGDKRETAVNIGYSCGLIKRHSTVLTLKDWNRSEDLGEAIRSGILGLRTAAHSVVIVDGHTLATVYKEPSGSLQAIFIDLVVLADSVICCRAQPSQKAQLVNGIKNRVPDSVTLAIGDGANDIAMIQEAHVGIGITGKEGFQAARSSDYSIAQFRFLPKLLLVHGRWNYIRVSKYILGTLWKEVVFFLTQALFQRWNGFTGTSLYEPWSLAQFNTLFTSIPVMVLGIFDQDLAATTLLAVPDLYETMGQKNNGLSLRVYFTWMAFAVAESMIVYFCMLTLYAHAETTRDSTLFSMSDLGFVATVIIVSVKLQIVEMRRKSFVVFLSLLLSAGAIFLWNILLSGIYPLMTPYKVRGAFFYDFGRDPIWWMSLIFIVVCVYVLEIGVSALRTAFFPTDTDIFQQLEHDEAYNQEFIEAAAFKSGERLTKYNDEPIDAQTEEVIPLQDFHR